MMVIAIFAIISNASVTGTANINDQFSKLNCPLPLYNQVDFGNGTIIDSRLTPDTGKNFGSSYICKFDPLTMAFGRQGVTTITINYVNYNSTTFNAFPDGWFKFVGDSLGALAFKVGAIGNLVAYILTPINFNLLGYTLASVSGLVLMAIVAIYILAYLPVAIMVYKGINPFTSLGA